MPGAANQVFRRAKLRATEDWFYTSAVTVFLVVDGGSQPLGDPVRPG
jgi:hypothetical protein